MSDEAKRTAIIKYFTRYPPPWTILAIFIGVVLLLGFAPLGLAVIGFGIWGIIKWKKKKPMDADMDRYREEDLAEAKAGALAKASIPESQLIAEQVVVSGPRFWDTAGATVLWKKGKDGISRFTPINVTVLSMTAQQIISYQCCLDMTTGKRLLEQTDEYFYKDVVSITTKTESLTKKTEKFGTIQLNLAEVFRLTTSGGTSIETILCDPELMRRMGGGKILTADADRAVQAIRKVLRDKKGTVAA